MTILKKLLAFYGEWTVLCVGLIVLVVSSRALLHPEFFRVHDYVHGARIAEMLTGLREGQFPVRWSGNFGFGYGMPLFEFYAPLPYYFGSFFYWLTGNLTLAVKMLWLTPNVLSFIGAYLLGRKLFGRAGGLVMAVAFTLAPYRAVNLYVRGAISESWGMMTFPWILLSVVELYHQGTRSWLRLTAWSTVLLLSHNLLTMMFSPVVGVLGVGLWVMGKLWPGERAAKKNSLSSAQSSVVTATHKKSAHRVQGADGWSWWQRVSHLDKYLVQFLGSLGLAIGLSAFYLIPALLEKQFTQIDQRILSGYFHYSQHFLYIRQFFRENWKYGGSVWGPSDDLSFFLGYGQLGVLLVLGAVMGWFIVQKFLKTRNQKSRSLPPVTFYFLLVACCLLSASLYLTLEKSKWLWDMIAPFHVIQFPWRWLSLAVLFLSTLNGATIVMIRSPFTRMVLVVLSTIVILVPAWRYFQPENYLSNADALYYSDPARIQTEMSEILPDFIPLQVSEDIAVRDFIVRIPGRELSKEQSNILVDRSHEKLVQLEVFEETLVEWAVAEYPGWQTFVDGEPVDHQVSAQGLIQLVVPAGTHEIGVQLQSTPVRQLANLISLGSLILVGVLFMTTQRDSPSSFSKNHTP